MADNSLPPAPITTTAPIAPATPPPSIKVAFPDKFDGTRSLFRGFLNQVELIFALQSSNFGTDTTKIYFLGTLLTGPALAWFNPFVENPSAFTNDLSSWASFRDLLKLTFGEADQSMLAASSISSLTQGQGSVTSFVTTFRQLAADLDWNDAALRDQFYLGLATPIKKLLINYATPTSLAALISLALECDNRLLAFRTLSNPRSNPSIPLVRNPKPVLNPPNPVSPTSPIPSPYSPMELDAVSRSRGPLTPEDRKFRMDNRLCLICGSNAHLRALCPIARKTGFPQGQ